MRISDWSSDVCSSDLGDEPGQGAAERALRVHLQPQFRRPPGSGCAHASAVARDGGGGGGDWASDRCPRADGRSTLMEPIAVVSGRAIPLGLKNIDTDIIIPAHYLKTIYRQDRKSVV